ncbi:MAG: hypothetical protein LBH93_01985, partial [Chitinispirillales bacterium]|nr:hypothetical protein [Chitinispirillales bacterium]
MMTTQNKNAPAASAPTVDKVAARLRKLANLQGFVTEPQMEDAVDTAHDIDCIREILEREQIAINTFVRERR